MRLPNGYGSVFKLSGNRRKSWAVRIVIGYNDKGSALYKYLGYYKTKKEGLQCLSDYHNNSEFYNKTTLGEIYKKWSEIRYSKVTTKTMKMYQFAWSYLEKLEDKDIQDIKKIHLQNILEANADKSRSAHKQIKSLAVQLFDYAMENDLVKRNYAEFMEVKDEVKKEKEIFTDMEIAKMWDNIDVPNMDIVLILIYTGYRIGELCNLTKFNVDLKNKVLRGGNKTEAGQNKIVGIHQSIYPLIKKRYDNSTNYLIEKEGKKVTANYLRKFMYYRALEKAEIKKRSPHTCRHTFASLLNRFVADKEFLPAVMGHTDKETTKIYTHYDDKQVYDAVNSIKI